MYPPTSIPNVATPPPGMSTAPAGSGGVPATMAVNYPQPTPQPFHAQSNPNFVQPSQTGPGFSGMPHPPSNPNFNPVQAPMAPYGGYSSNQGFGQPPTQPSSGAGKFIAIGLGAILLIGGIGTAVALSGNSNSNGGTSPLAGAYELQVAVADKHHLHAGQIRPRAGRQVARGRGQL